MQRHDVTIAGKHGEAVPYGRMMKVFWDDGGISFFTANKSKQEFYDPSEPRDERGRWTDEGGGAVDITNKKGKVTEGEKDVKGSDEGSIERSGDASARSGFSAAIQRAKAAHKFGWAVDDRGEAFYQDPKTRIFLTKEGDAGGAVAPDGEATSLFKHPDSKVDVHTILKELMPAGNHATAFDTNGYLPNLYSKYGYVPIARVAFDPKQAPEGWKPEMGKPDVVVLVKDENGVLGAPTGDYNKIKSQVPVVSYDEAVKMQRTAVMRSGGETISNANIERYRGDVKSDELAKHKDSLTKAFKMTDTSYVVPISSLVSDKNELLDPKFLRGEKGDPRQTATDRMVDVIEGRSDKKRDPLSVKDNNDGTYTIKDGNATAQAAMLAGWTKLPVEIERTALDRVWTEGVGGKETVGEFLERHGKSVNNDGTVTYYHGTPKKGGAKDTLRAGSYLADTEEEAAFFAGRDRGLKPKDITVYKVDVPIDAFEPGVHPTINRDLPLWKKAK
jgi:hypothetical protein